MKVHFRFGGQRKKGFPTNLAPNERIFRMSMSAQHKSILPVDAPESWYGEDEDQYSYKVSVTLENPWHKISGDKKKFHRMLEKAKGKFRSLGDDKVTIKEFQGGTIIRGDFSTPFSADQRKVDSDLNTLAKLLYTTLPKALNVEIAKIFIGNKTVR